MQRPVRMDDPTALEEIRLYAEIVVTAARSPRKLTTEEIDALLGLSPGPPGPVGTPVSRAYAQSDSEAVRRRRPPGTR
jgi:hypothetical protein